MDWVNAILAIGAGYLVGGIPPGLLLGKLLRRIDIREHGSGKIGATNVQRTLGWGPAVLTLAIDIGKGAAAILLAQALVGGVSRPLADVSVALAGLAAIAGHNWSAFLSFRGGRGISPAIGAAIALAPWAALPAFLLGAVVVVLTDMVSPGSLVGTLTGLALFVVGAIVGWISPIYLIYALPAAGILVVSHHDNISRILRGEERKLGLRERGRKAVGGRQKAEGSRQ